jgi:hypothetical protein
MTGLFWRRVSPDGGREALGKHDGMKKPAPLQGHVSLGRFVLLPKGLVTDRRNRATLLRLTCPRWAGRTLLWKGDFTLKPRLSRGFLYLGELSPAQTAPTSYRFYRSEPPIRRRALTEPKGFFVQNLLLADDRLNLRGFDCVPVLKALSRFIRPRAFFVACLPG